jgi:hypothetical protein
MRGEMHRRRCDSSHYSSMERAHATKLIGIIGIAGTVIILLAFPIQKIEPAIPTITLPGPYPYETPVRISAPPTAEASPAPSPAPFPYPDSSRSLSPAQDRDSQIANSRRPLTAKTVREIAFKHNRVANFCEFLAALPADVRVFDPKIGRTRTLVEGGRVVRKNVAWLRRDKQARPKPNDRRLLSVEEIGARNSGI